MADLKFEISEEDREEILGPGSMIWVECKRRSGRG